MPEMTLEQAMQLALSHHSAGRLREAESIYRQVLAAVPDQPDALSMLGAIASQVGQHKAAAELMSRSLKIRPNVAEYNSNYGLVLSHLGDIAGALSHLRKAVELNPQYAIGWYNLGNVLRSDGQFEQAIEAYRRSLQIDPNSAWTHNNLGHVLMDMKRFAESIEPIREAIRLSPQADFYTNLGTALWGLGRTDESLEACREAIRLKPNGPEFHSNLAVSLKEQGYTTEATEAFRRAVELAPQAPVYRSNYLYMLHFDPGIDPATLLKEHRQWEQFHGQPLRRQIKPHDNDRDPERRLRIGYVSPDFREHPVGRFIVPLLKHHDRAACEIYCYSSNLTADAVTAQCRAHADHWRLIHDKTDDGAAAMIRADQIDILVDLSAHGANNRLPVFARKPAPVQVTYLAYPSTTGMETIDYRITDPYLDPPGAYEAFYTEKTVRLPETYWCYAAGAETPQVNALPALSSGHVTFGCLNTFRKVSIATQRIWAALLKRMEGARLLLHAKEGAHRQRFADLLAGEGIDPARVEFISQLPLKAYFETYHRIDVGLDPFPYTGGTTTCDALYMGVPVVSLVGDRAVYRGGLSLLSNVGLPELVATTTEQYLTIAERLASDLEALANLRATLRPRMQRSPLMDAAGLARHIEQAYRQMWRTWCAGESV
jgi:predicted O-linked N-acetylglucosamine transferase (SPINDLY family)